MSETVATTAELAAQAGKIDDNAANERQHEDGSVRKTYYGDGLQPWDIIKANGWAAHFAAGNVLKYMRRAKGDDASDRKKAYWYYDQLCLLARDNPMAEAARRCILIELNSAEFDALIKAGL